MSNANLHSLFENQVLSSPDAFAVVYEQQIMTYSELNYRANQLAHYLIELGVATDTRIAIHLPRSLDLIIGFLAVLKAGGVYVPVDPSYPRERIQFILTDSEASFLLTDSKLCNGVPILDVTIPHIDLQSIPDKQYSGKNPHLPIQSTDLAYIIYTSGSTGQPKGVLIEHRNIVNATLAFALDYPEPIKKLLLLLSTAFDGSFAGIYWTLSQGGVLVLPPSTAAIEPSSINALIHEHQITDLICTPSIYHAYLPFIHDKDRNLSRILLGGENCTRPLMEMHKQLLPTASVINIYGPTEATVWTSSMRVYDHSSQTIAPQLGIGHAIANTTLTILDHELEECDTNMEGEIYIGGAGLARGYLNQPELTAKQFLIHPVNHSRLYKTGDRGCYLNDKLIAYLGRCDEQIKWQGFRIELGEIETTLHTHEQILQAAVLLQDNQSSQQLTAYLQMKQPFSASQQTQFISTIRQYAEKKLPHYMIPSAYIFLSSFPLTANGKIDRKQLAKLQPNCAITENVTEKLTAIESAIRQIWITVLGISQISLNDNFFALGGHSLSAARIANKIAQDLQKNVPIRVLYQTPILQQFAEAVAQYPRIEAENLSAVYDQKRLALHGFQWMYWLSNLVETSDKNLNVVGRKRLQGTLDKPLLDQALQIVLQKQGVFAYHIHRYYPLQRRCNRSTLSKQRWSETSLLHLSETEIEIFLTQKQDDLFYKKSWKTNTVWLQADLYYLPDNHLELQICMPHLIADDDSITIFFQELSNAYLGSKANTSLSIDNTHHAYQRYYAQQSQLLQQSANKDYDFWFDYLRDAGLFPIPPSDKVLLNKPVIVHTPLSENFMEKLQKICVQHQLGLTDVINAAVSWALLQCSEHSQPLLRQKLWISMLKSTRENLDYAQAMGCFLRLDVIKLDLNGQPSFISLAKQAQQASQETAPYQQAATLVKTSTIGTVPSKSKPVIQFFMGRLLSLLAQCFPRWQLTPSLIYACKNIITWNLENQLLVHVNIAPSFVQRRAAAIPSSLGLSLRPIPLYPQPLVIDSYTFEVVFHCNNDQSCPYMISNGAISLQFHERFQKTLLSLIENHPL